MMGSLAPSLTVVVHRDVEVLTRLARPLEEMERATRTPVTARGTWLLCWLRAHPEVQPLVVTVHADRRVVAAAVLACRRRGAYLEVRPAGAGNSDEIRLPASNAAAADALAHGVVDALGDLGRPWRVVLRDLPQDDPVVARLHELLPYSKVVPGDVSPRLALGPARDLRSYVSRNRHQQSRRLHNRLLADGHRLEVQHLRTPSEIEAVMPAVLEVHRARDLQVRGATDLDRPEDQRFFEVVVYTHAARGEVCLTILRAGPTLVAYVLCFVDDDVWRMWNCRFDPEWSRYGPGRLSHEASLEAALAAGATTYDWMRGQEGYKDGLSDHSVRMVDLHAASGAVMWTALQVAAWGRSVLRGLRASSPVGRSGWELLVRSSRPAGHMSSGRQTPSR